MFNLIKEVLHDKRFFKELKLRSGFQVTSSFMYLVIFLDELNC